MPSPNVAPPTVVALIVAAGRGSRFHGPLPKQYMPLNGYPILRRTLATFLAHPAITAVRAVIHPDDDTLFEQAARGLTVMAPVHGGAERQESVRLGLESLRPLSPDLVLVHDGARPFVSREVIDRVLGALDDREIAASIPGVPVTDTLKRVDQNTVMATIPRHDLWRAQTPQGFRFAPILAAHQAQAGQAQAGQALTDDAAVAEASGLRVEMVRGTARNSKITVPDDVPPEQGLAQMWEPRVGSGFDVHRFGEGTQVMLCGTRIPHGAALCGHSDADVGLHALTDALYGAIGAGDIGHHFPPEQERWKGCDSAVFLNHARCLVEALGGRLSHVDVTLICQSPKIGPLRSAMVRRLAQLLQMESERVSIKATTTENLGFTGRQEGIAAQATATVLFPSPPAL